MQASDITFQRLSDNVREEILQHIMHGVPNSDIVQRIKDGFISAHMEKNADRLCTSSSQNVREAGMRDFLESGPPRDFYITEMDVANLRREVDKLQWQFDEDVQKSAVLFCLQNSADILYNHQQRPRPGTPDYDFFLSQLGREASGSMCSFMDCQPGQVYSPLAQPPAPMCSLFVQPAAPQIRGEAGCHDMEPQPLPGGQVTLQDSDVAGADPAFLGANVDLNRPETINLDRLEQVESVDISVNGKQFTYNINNWTPFCCAIMTRSGVEAAIKWGHNSVLQLDSTFGSNAQKFPLFTLLAVDEHSKGVPLAYLVASHERVELIQEFLEAVKAKVCFHEPLPVVS